MFRSLLFFSLFANTIFALPAVHNSREGQTLEDNQVFIAARDEWWNTTGYGVKLSGFEGCDRRDECGEVKEGWRRDVIVESLRDMIRMMPITKIGAPDFDSPDFPRSEYVIDWNSAAAIEYLGSEIRSGSYRPAIQKNFNTLAGIDLARFWGVDIHVRCDDPVNECGEETDAYVVHGTSNGENMWDHVNFCSHFFHKQDTLDNTVDKVASGEAEKNPEELMNYRNRATVWAHELLHISWIGKVAGVDDRAWMTDEKYGTDTDKWIAYSAIQCKYLAGSDRSPEFSTVNNPQSYMYVALANYIVKTKDFYPSEGTWTLADDPPARDTPSFSGPSDTHGLNGRCSI